MEDFNWKLTIKTATFTVTLNECNDGSPWVGDIVCSDDAVTYDELVAVVADAWDMEEVDAEDWLLEAFEKRIDWQRRNV